MAVLHHDVNTEARHINNHNAAVRHANYEDNAAARYHFINVVARYGENGDSAVTRYDGDSAGKRYDGDSAVARHDGNNSGREREAKNVTARQWGSQQASRRLDATFGARGEGL